MVIKKNKTQKKSAEIFKTEVRLSPLEKIRGRLPDLMESDLIFIRNKKSLLRYFLRKVTKSYWDHVALVLFPKNKAKGYFYNLIIEAVDPSGIEIHKLNKYLNNPDKYDVGIKRVPNIQESTRQRIMAYMLMNVDAPYYRFKFWKFFFASFSKEYNEEFLGRQRYSCSGFVQKAFYEAAGWEERESFIFREDFLSPMELQEITTPGDIAKSHKSDWIYNKH
jgi:hypothetical protein